MKRSLALLLSLQLAMPVPALFAAGITSTGDCEQKLKLDIEQPLQDESAIRKSCEGAAEPGACGQTYQKLSVLYQQYNNQALIGCQTALGGADAATGADAQAAAKTLNENAAKALTSLKERLDKDRQELDRDYIHKNLQLAYGAYAAKNPRKPEEEKEHRETSQKARAGAGISSRAEKETLQKRARKLDPKVGLQLAATQEAIRFRTQLEEKIKKIDLDLNQLQTAATTAAENDQTRSSLTDDDTKESGVTGNSGGSPFSLSDIVPLATLGLGAAAFMKGQQQTDDSGITPPADLNAGQNPSAPTNPDGATLEKRNPAATNLKPGEDQPKSADISSSANSPAGIDGTAGLGSDGAASSGSEGGAGAGNDTGQFSGSLGNGSLGADPLSAATAGGSGGSSASNLDEILDPAKAPAKAESDAGMDMAGGGGIPGYAGGASSSSSEDPMKDLFKADPFAPPGSGAEGSLEGTFGALAGEVGTDPLGELQGNAVPGASDSRSLFSRVRDSHKRCLKRGCVTAEVGGKI